MFGRFPTNTLPAHKIAFLPPLIFCLQMELSPTKLLAPMFTFPLKVAYGARCVKLPTRHSCSTTVFVFRITPCPIVANEFTIEFFPIYVENSTVAVLETLAVLSISVK